MEQVGVAEEQRGSWLCREIPPSPTDHCPKCHQGLSSPRSRPQLFSGPEGSVLVELSLHEVCAAFTASPTTQEPLWGPPHVSISALCPPQAPLTLPGCLGYLQVQRGLIQVLWALQGWCTQGSRMGNP